MLTSFRILLATVTASLPLAASAVPITYVVDTGFGPSEEGGDIRAVGTVTVDDAGPTVTDWEITISSTPLGRSFTLDPINSSFISIATTLTPTSTQLVIDMGALGVWGPQLRDDTTTLRQEWLLTEDQGRIGEQIFLDFADPDPDSDFIVVPNLRDQTILLAAPVPEPVAPAQLACAVAVLAAMGGAHGSRLGPRRRG